MLERGDDTGGGECPAFGRDPGRGIEADGILGLAGVEVADIIDAGARDGVENILGEVAVRIDDGNASPAKMSAMARLKRKVVLPEPDLPTIQTWRSRSSREKTTLPHGGCCNWE